MRLYGDAHVSSKEQNLDRQVKELKSYDKNIIIFKDKATGKDFNRP